MPTRRNRRRRSSSDASGSDASGSDASGSDASGSDASGSDSDAKTTTTTASSCLESEECETESSVSSRDDRRRRRRSSRRKRRSSSKARRRNRRRNRRHRSDDDDDDDDDSASDDDNDPKRTKRRNRKRREKRAGADRKKKKKRKKKKEPAHDEEAAMEPSAMSNLLLLTLLQDCANRKKQRRARALAYSSDSDSDSDYVPGEESDDGAGDAEAGDTGGADPKRPKRPGRARAPRHVSRRAAHKAIAKLRGGEIGEDEERYLKRLPAAERGRIVGIARDVMRRVRNEKPLLYRLLDWPVSARTKAVVCERLSRFDQMEPGEGEHAKLASWVAGLEKLPIGTYCALPVDVRADPPERVGAFLADARTALDAAVYGHEAAKDDIVRLCAQWIRNPNAPLQALALQGPMGVGKTTLVKNGIAKAMGRPFQFVALGGAQDASFLHGFEYTYEGARPGRIADAVKDAGVMNPVIFFDELDKVSDTPRGREIQQTLVHLLDRTQNTQFQDRYFAGIDLDLSRAAFVVSYNDPSKIDPILLDRMRVVETRGFDTAQKLKITRQFVLPEAIEQIGLAPGSVTVDDGAVKHLIANYTKSEKGVRCLQRCIHQIIAEVNLRRLLGKLPEDKPTHVTQDTVDGFVKSLRTKGANASLANMYM